MESSQNSRSPRKANFRPQGAPDRPEVTLSWSHGGPPSPGPWLKQLHEDTCPWEGPQLVAYAEILCQQPEHQRASPGVHGPSGPGTLPWGPLLRHIAPRASVGRSLHCHVLPATRAGARMEDVPTQCCV